MRQGILEFFKLFFKLTFWSKSEFSVNSSLLLATLILKTNIYISIKYVHVGRAGVVKIPRLSTRWRGGGGGQKVVKNCPRGIWMVPMLKFTRGKIVRWTLLNFCNKLKVVYLFELGRVDFLLRKVEWELNDLIRVPGFVHRVVKCQWRTVTLRLKSDWISNLSCCNRM